MEALPADRGRDKSRYEIPWPIKAKFYVMHL